MLICASASWTYPCACGSLTVPVTGHMRFRRAAGANGLGESAGDGRIQISIQLTSSGCAPVSPTVPARRTSVPGPASSNCSTRALPFDTKIAGRSFLLQIVGADTERSTGKVTFAVTVPARAWRPGLRPCTDTAPVTFSGTAPNELMFNSLRSAVN